MMKGIGSRESGIGADLWRNAEEAGGSVEPGAGSPEQSPSRPAASDSILQGIDTVTVFASDLARSAGFFRDALGLPVRYEEPGWVEFDAGGAILAVSGGGTASAEPKGLAAQPVQASFRVADRDAAVRTLQARGVPFSGLADQPYGKIATFEDPDGNRFQLYEPGACRSDEGRTAEDAAAVPGASAAVIEREDIGTE